MENNKAMYLLSKSRVIFDRLMKSSINLEDSEGIEWDEHIDGLIDEIDSFIENNPVPKEVLYDPDRL